MMQPEVTEGGYHNTSPRYRPPATLSPTTLLHHIHDTSVHVPSEAPFHENVFLRRVATSTRAT